MYVLVNPFMVYLFTNVLIHIQLYPFIVHKCTFLHIH
uniref:Uncharacterized protein n=1 Tax=Arundo donax TaxID=35708 RepID=A0A0A9IMA8_ARUDO